jgi:hypothetical protein
VAWRTVVAAQHSGGIDWLGDHPRLLSQGHLAAWFQPTPARHVRLTETVTPRHAARWAVAELLLYEAVDDRPSALPGLSAENGQAVLDAVIAEGVRGLYSFDEANAWFARLRPPTATKLGTVSLHDLRPPAASGRVVNFRHKRAFFVREASGALEGRLSALGVPWERRACRPACST